MSDCGELMLYFSEQCSKLVDGRCTIVRCLRRGGHKSGAPIDYAIATCEEYEILAVLKDIIARAEKAETERDKMLMEMGWVASIAGISGPKEEIAKSVVDIVIERDKWRELARGATAYVRHVHHRSALGGTIEHDTKTWLTKFKELEDE